APDGEEGDDGKPIIINYHSLLYNKKGRFQVNIAQSFDQYGSLSISGNHQSYCNRTGKDAWHHAAHSPTWNGLNSSVSPPPTTPP
ncbi:fimbria/pilus outer membrane usher protein, partial [Morganella morganii]|uniref:fimbria/pilus outer membrane usher protein n=1 Tax=Morganella morganii TaxID=582 RepID=UPI0015F61C4F